MIETKRCSACKEVKVIEDFYKNKSAKDGLNNYCKICFKAKSKVYHAKWYYQSGGKEQKKGYHQSPAGKITIYKASQKHYWQGNGKRQRKEYHQQNREKTFEYVKKWQKNNPEKVKAYKYLNHKVEKGLFPNVKTKKCIHCNKQAEQYHHHKGYEPQYWLEVVPVCTHCHHKIHYGNL